LLKARVRALDHPMTMSLSPSSSQGAPTLAEVLLQRTFARPPRPFADGELLQALAHPAKPADAAPSADDASAPSSDGSTTGRNVDVRV
jgi:hypothetical protein